MDVSAPVGSSGITRAAAARRSHSGSRGGVGCGRNCRSFETTELSAIVSKAAAQTVQTPRWSARDSISGGGSRPEWNARIDSGLGQPFRFMGAEGLIWLPSQLGAFTGPPGP